MWRATAPTAKDAEEGHQSRRRRVAADVAGLRVDLADGSLTRPQLKGNAAVAACSPVPGFDRARRPDEARNRDYELVVRLSRR
jgi:hypothetical protein